MTRAILAFAVACMTAWPVVAQQPTFSSRREIVRVDVLVTDGDRAVRGLQASDFEILDSGVPQQIDFASFEQLPVNVVLALDASASISARRLADLRDAGHAVLADLKSADQSALLTFADAVTVRERLGSNVGQLRAALDAMEPAPETSHGGTALVDACYLAMTLADTDAARDLLMAFTDGLDTTSWLRADRVLQVARRSNVVTYAVSTSKLQGSFLHALSEETGGGAIEIASTADLRATFVRILDEFRQRYLLTYSPANVPADGWHPLTVRVKGRRVDVKARAGYAK